MKKVLIAEDGHVTARVFESMIRELNHEVVGVAYSATETIELVRKFKPELVFLDIYMENKTAILWRL